MKAQIEALKRERANLVRRSQDIFDRAAKEGRSPNSEELSEITNLQAEASKKGDEAKQLEDAWQTQERHTADLGASTGRRVGLRADDSGNPDKVRVIRFSKDAAGKPRVIKLRPGTAEHRRASREYRSGFSNYLRTGGPSAVLQTDISTSGGYLAPPQYNAELIENLDNMLFVRRLATVVTTDAPEFSTPYRSADITAAVRGAELGSPTADTALAFGLRKLRPSYITGQVNISRDLRRSSVVDVDGLVNQRIAFRVGELEEQEFMTGSGAALQALGMFTASADGIPTSRDVNSGAAADITADGFLACKAALTMQYRSSPSIGWIFHRDTCLRLWKLKDTNGRPLFQASLVAGEPDTLCGFKVYESEYAPNTYTNGSYVGILGDIRYYWIADGMGLEIQVLDQTGAAANQDQVIYRRKMDACPVQPLAFARLKLSA